MEIDSSFQGTQYLSSLFPPTKTMFPSQSPILIPPSPQPIMFHPNNTFHYLQNHIMNVPTQNPAFVVEGPSSNINTPLYGGSFLGGFVNISHHRPMTISPNNNNNKMDALHGDHHKGKIIWDFSKQLMVHSSEASSSKSSSPLSLSNEYGLVMSDYHRHTNQRSMQQKMKANDNIIKGQWTLEQDNALVELVNQLGLKKRSQIAKLLPGRIGSSVGKDGTTISSQTLRVTAAEEESTNQEIQKQEEE